MCGVGLFGGEGGTWPTIFVDAPDIQGDLVAVDVSEYPAVNEAIGFVFPDGRDWLTHNLKIVRVAPCAKHANTAEKIRAAMRGRLGARVQWAPTLGYLTAGHVGQRVGNAVIDAAGVRIGSVVFANDPQPNQATADIDIALVQCDTGVTVNNSLGIRTVATARANDRVIVHTLPGRQNATVVAYCKWFAASGVTPADVYTFADVYLSSRAVTVDGDSGGPVTLGGNTHGVIGHVVAGGRNTSCFQDIKPQMARVRSDPQFAALTF